jgi:hypothetical protein
MMTSYLNSDPGGLCFSKPYQFPPHDGRRVDRRSPQKLIYKISVIMVHAFAHFPRKFFSAYWTFYTSISRLDPPHPTHAFCSEQEDIRGGTQGAAERGRFARSGSTYNLVAGSW